LSFLGKCLYYASPLLKLYYYSYGEGGQRQDNGFVVVHVLPTPPEAMCYLMVVK